MMILKVFVLSGVLLFAQSTGPKKKVSPPKSKIEVYDPDHLSPGEVACGRSHGPDACKCMVHRIKQSEEEQKQCYLISDKHERAICMILHEACSIIPVDVDHAGWTEDGSERMPSQCKRSCTKARCECCQS